MGSTTGHGEDGKPQHVVSVEWLAGHLDDPSVVVLEASIDLDSSTGTAISMRAAFDTAHIPGSVFVDMIAELSDPAADARMAHVGRMFMLPEPAVFAEVMGRAGVGPDTLVVASTRSSPMWSARLWWMLRYFGHERVVVLDGGFDAWVTAGRPVTTAPSVPVPARFDARPRRELLATREDVLACGSDDDAVVINALRPELFRGEEAGRRPRPGRIPGSVNVPFLDVYDAEGRLRAPDVLRPLFAAVGALDAERVVTYCGGGIAAASDALALATLGVDAALYDGSLNEWSSDPDPPLELG